MTLRSSVVALGLWIPAVAQPALPSALLAQNTSGTHQSASPLARATARAGSIVIDGRLEEADWRDGQPARDFTQQEPSEGKPATQATEVRFVFDNEALYIGARMYDSLGAGGVRSRLTRRDQVNEGDYIEFVFDTFHDHTGRTVLLVNPSGVRQDAGQSSSYADPSWDPIWVTAAQIDSLGWTAELRIPWAQLRFSRDSSQTWGLQIWRYVERLNESSMWSFWGKTESGGPARFGHLEGLRVAERPRGIELLPYVVSRAAYVRPNDAESPFERPRDYDTRVGADIKALLTSNLTLDATFNPDFGQVEVDPAVVNLSAFETFFPEKRPFFVEGSGLFGFGSFNCFFCSNVSSLSLFYSRRIGRQPQGFLRTDYQHIDVPENSTILGAAKITGRTAGGYQVGLMNAVTNSADARVIAGGDSVIQRELEPLTNYFVGRAKKNFRGGDVVLGAIGTSVIRRIGYDSLALLIPRHAEAVGADWDIWWKKRTYRVMGNFALSEANGDRAAILRLQRSSARYFQRPDRQHGGNRLFSDRFDPSLTTLRGFGGYVRAAKDAGKLLWETSLNYRSPGFEVNDVAFLTRADYVWMNGNVFRQWTKPTRWYRRADVIAGAQQQYNFDGDVTDRQIHAFTGGQLANYWWVSLFHIVRPEVFEDRLTRGGPVVRRARNYTTFLNLNTDSRKRVVLSTNPSYGKNSEGAGGYSFDLGVRVKPASNVSVSLSPEFSRSASSAQFVRSFDDPTATRFYGKRVVFADITQRTLSMDTRLNVTFTPALTLELFAQPFISSGEYRNFKEFSGTRVLEKSVYDSRQVRVTATDASGEQTYTLDVDRDPATPNFTFANPDFNFRSLRGNAVLRWEYRPGSTFFLVWAQNRDDSIPFGDFDFSRDRAALFSAHPDNVFLVKVNYWIGM